jgi:hypothetical protein
MKVEVVEDDDPVRVLEQFFQLVSLSFCRHVYSLLENPNLHKKLAILIAES